MQIFWRTSTWSSVLKHLVLRFLKGMFGISQLVISYTCPASFAYTTFGMMEREFTASAVTYAATVLTIRWKLAFWKVMSNVLHTWHIVSLILKFYPFIISLLTLRPRCSSICTFSKVAANINLYYSLKSHHVYLIPVISSL